MLRKSFAPQKVIRLSVVLAGMVSFAFAQSKPIPQLTKNGDKYTFLVDGKPFLILGAQVGNFSAFPDRMESGSTSQGDYVPSAVRLPSQGALIRVKLMRY
jgi:hypothetical protein